MIDRSLISLEKLLDAMLSTSHGNVNQWMQLVEIIPDYMPPYPRPETKPTCVVRFRDSFLRYSKGVRQGYFWDGCGDDMLSPEWALLAVLQAPVPPSALVKNVWKSEMELMCEANVETH